MGDRHNDDVERGWREEDRRRQAGEGDYGRGWRGRDSEDRSFSSRREYEDDRNTPRPELTGPRYGAGGYTGYGDRKFGDRGYGEPNYSTGRQDAGAERFGPPRAVPSERAPGGGYSGDDDRQAVYREPYGEGRPGYDARRYDQAFQGPRERHWEFGFGYDLDGAEGRYRGDGADRDPDRGFWGRRGRELFGGGEGVHRGRGPLGYKRSDERINEDIHERLTEDPHVDASGIVVAVKDGEVTLSGRVDCREAKHRAEHLVEHVSGVGHVQNNLRVEAGVPARTSGPTVTGPTSAAPLGENTKLSEQAAGKT